MMMRKVLPIIRRGFLNEYSKSKLNCLSKNGLSPVNNSGSVNAFQNLFTSSVSRYAKGKDIKKNKKTSTYLNENELAEYFDTEKLFSEISKPVNHFKQELLDHVSLRTSQDVIENIKIQLDGNTYKIQDLAEIWKKNPKLYVLDFSEFPQAIPIAVGVIQQSHLNINVQQDGTKLFVPILKVTKEHREVLVKKAKVFFIKCKDDIRNVQMKYSKKMRNVEGVSEDVKKSIAEQLTYLGNKHISMAEEILKKKTEELIGGE